MRIFKWLLIALLIAFIMIQFFRPEKNISTQVSGNEITAMYPMPGEVKTIMAKACNDCHTNNTRYPWYAEIQPIAWWLADHVEEGKEHVNYSEFGTYGLRKQYHKLEETEEMVKEKEMPLDSYTWMHRDATLTDEERQQLVQWSVGVRKLMESRYPIDSLIRKVK